MSLGQTPREGEVLLQSTYSLAALTGLPSCCLCLLASQCKRKHVMLCCCVGITGLQWDTFVTYLYIYNNVIEQGPVHPLALRTLLLLQADDLLLLQSTQIWWFLCLKTINWIISSFFLFTEGNIRSHKYEWADSHLYCLLQGLWCCSLRKCCCFVHYVLKSGTLWSTFNCMYSWPLFT